MRSMFRRAASRLKISVHFCISTASRICRGSGQHKYVTTVPGDAATTGSKDFIPWARTQKHWIIVTLAALFGALGIHGESFADYVVQVGAFRASTSAHKRAGEISRLGFPAFTDDSDGNITRNFITVLVGPYKKTSEAESVRAEVNRNGIDGFVRFYANQKNDIAPSSKIDVPAYLVTSGREHAASADLIAEAPQAQKPEFKQIAAAEPSQTSVGAPAKSAEGTLPFSLSGHAQTAIAYTVASPDHWSKIKNTLHLAAERALATDINLKVSGRFSYDGAYDVSNFYPDRVKRDQRFEAMFHETFLDVGLNDWNFRIGRQNIVWGEVVGLFFADVVTAKDLREFLVPEFDYIRIPQWATRAEYFTGDFKAEAIWIPYMTYDQIGKPGSEFYPFAIPPPPGFRQNIRSERTPHSLRDSSFGMRASYLTNGWDLGAFYYGSMDSNPTFFRSIVLAPVPTVRYQPDHERIHQTGLTVSKDVGSFVIKGEAIYTWDRYFNVTRAADSDGVIRQDFFDYILSAEIPLPMDSRINLQFFQRIFTKHDADIIPRRVESGATLFASTKLLDDKVEPELLVIHSLNRLDWMTRFKVSWNFAKDWRVVAGTAFFGGKNLGLFGRFDQKDRVFTEIRYSF